MKKKLTVIFMTAIFSIFSLNAQSADTWIDLAENAEKSSMTMYWDPFSQMGVLEKSGHSVSFHVGDEVILKDYSEISVEDAPKFQDGKLLVTKSFFTSVENFFYKKADTNSYKIGAILIDPGHGGKDPGAYATHTVDGKKFTVYEKNVNLKIGLMLYDLLSKNYPDKKIMMTRSTDVFLELGERTDIANSVKLGENEAIIYISIHVNASPNKDSVGYEVWYLSPGYRRQLLSDDSVDDASLQPILNSMLEEEYTTESILIAKLITDGIGEAVGAQSSSRGIKEEEWFVVRNANMPSVLVETGFLSNPKEAALLADDSYLKKLSVGIYNGLRAFVTHFERSRGFTENE